MIEECVGEFKVSDRSFAGLATGRAKRRVTGFVPSWMTQGHGAGTGGLEPVPCEPAARAVWLVPSIILGGAVWIVFLAAVL